MFHVSTTISVMSSYAAEAIKIDNVYHTNSCTKIDLLGYLWWYKTPNRRKKTSKVRQDFSMLLLIVLCCFARKTYTLTTEND